MQVGPRRHVRQAELQGGRRDRHLVADAGPLSRLGEHLPIKSIRSEEDVTVEVILADMALEQVALALNSNTVTTTAAGTGTPGDKAIQLYRGPDVAQMALLARGPSPYFASGYAQFEL